MGGEGGGRGKELIINVYHVYGKGGGVTQASRLPF